jgi:mannose-6-phosphate isomerase
MMLQKHNSFGKTEMWYIMQADEDRIIVGFKKIQMQNYLEKLKENKPYSILDSVNVKEGMCFF